MSCTMERERQSEWGRDGGGRKRTDVDSESCLSGDNQYLTRTLSYFLKMEPNISYEKRLDWDFTVKNKSEKYEKKFVLYFVKWVIIIC